MKLIETEFGEVILTINGGEHYLAEWVQDKEEWNDRCEEYCSLAGICMETLGGRKFCEPFSCGLPKTFIFTTEEPEKIEEECV